MVSNGVASKLQLHLHILTGSLAVTIELTHLLTARGGFYSTGAELRSRGETSGLPKLEIFTAGPFLSPEMGCFNALLEEGACSFFSIMTINVKPLWPSL